MHCKDTTSFSQWQRPRKSVIFKKSSQKSKSLVNQFFSYLKKSKSLVNHIIFSESKVKVNFILQSQKVNDIFVSNCQKVTFYRHYILTINKLVTSIFSKKVTFWRFFWNFDRIKYWTLGKLPPKTHFDFCLSLKFKPWTFGIFMQNFWNNDFFLTPVNKQ